MALMMFAVFLEKDDVKNFFKFIDILFWINLVVTFIQYFALGYMGDRLGGVFGVEIGSNGSTIMFLTIIVAKKVLDYMNAKIEDYNFIYPQFKQEYSQFLRKLAK